jgi:hypothetical protein
VKVKAHESPPRARQAEEGQYSSLGIFFIVWTTVVKLRDKASIIMWSSFVLAALWGFHGDMAILTGVLGEGWTQAIAFGLPWGRQLASFVVGFLLMVVIPSLIIKFVFKEKVRDYGLGLPDREQRGKALQAFLWLTAITSVFIYISTFDRGMQLEYPLFVQRTAGQVTWTITSPWEFAAYELVYLLFFITIEFSFRGYLLLGLDSIRAELKVGGHSLSFPRFGIYAILIQMLAYTTWHYGKPVPELVGTLFWGIFAAAVVLRIRSIWPIVLSHWLYNVLLDWLLWIRFPPGS